jgi:hypothetical protein
VKKWTKRSIGEMRQAIDSCWVCNRPLDFRGWPTFKVAFADALATRRQEIVISEIKSLRDIAERRERDDLGFIEHLRAHPEVYGASTPEMITRWDGHVADERKAIAYCDALIARIEAEGLPPEVVEYNGPG